MMNIRKLGASRLANQVSLVALAVATLSAGAAGAQTAGAQGADASGKVTDVVVTATRRSEKLQDVPISASVLTSAPLEAMATAGQDIRQLAFVVPSLNIESSNGRTFPRFYIRGYGNTDFTSFASQPVSLVYDDIDQENPALKGFPMFDLADVEVLRGPQGTLFGRNTPAGVVKVESAKPSLSGFGGYFNVSDATYNTGNFEGAVNLPITQTIAARLSAQDQHRDNWVADPINGTHLEGYDDVALRAQVLYQPSDNFSALFNVHGRNLEGSARLFRANSIQSGSDKLIPGFDPAKIYTDGQNDQSYGSVGSNLHLTWKLGDIKVSSITGYESILHYFTKGDIDGGYGASYAPPYGPGFIPFAVETSGGISNHRQWTQEFRAESDYAGPLNWQTGIYLFDESVTAPSFDYSNVGTSADYNGKVVTGSDVSRQQNDAEAVYASVDYKLTSKLKLTAGVRDTEDHKRFDVLSVTGDMLPLFGSLTKKATASRVSWDASAFYQAEPDLNLYARVATGFRAPSFGAPSASQAIQVAKAEDVTSFEVGFKAFMFDRKARLDFDIYDFTVDHQQLTAVGGTSNVTTLLNAARTEGRGAELDFEAHPFHGLVITAGGSYNFTRIDDPGLSVGVCGSCTVINPINSSGNAEIDGNPLPQAPQWTADWTLRYSHPLFDGEAYFYTDWTYRSKVNFFLYESVEFDGPALLQGGLRAGYKFSQGKYDVAVFCRNCTNQVEAIGGIDFDNLTSMINDPRIVGVQFSGKF